MEISVKRQNTLVKLTLQNAVNTLRAGLPEFSRDAMKRLQEDMEILLDDLIESHIAGLTEEEMEKKDWGKW